MKLQFIKLKGFSFIEMIVAIVVIAILTAVALPRVFDFRDDAEVAQVEAIRAALRLAINEVHGLSIQQGSNNLVVPYRNMFMFVDSTGFYPEAVGSTTVPGDATSAVDNALTDVAECIALWENLLIQAPSVGATATSCTNGCEFVATITGTTQCNFTYQQDLSLVISYTLSGGEIY